MSIRICPHLVYEFGLYSLAPCLVGIDSAIMMFDVQYVSFSAPRGKTYCCVCLQTESLFSTYAHVVYVKCENYVVVIL